MTPLHSRILLVCRSAHSVEIGCLTHRWLVETEYNPGPAYETDEQIRGTCSSERVGRASTTHIDFSDWIKTTFGSTWRECIASSYHCENEAKLGRVCRRHCWVMLDAPFRDGRAGGPLAHGLWDEQSPSRRPFGCPTPFRGASSRLAILVHHSFMGWR